MKNYIFTIITTLIVALFSEQVIAAYASNSSGGLASINGDTTSAAVIAGSNNVSVSTTSGTTTVSGSLLAPKASPTFTGTIGTPLTASKVITTDGSSNLAASSVSTTTLGFLDATSSIQTQLNNKAPTASPTFSGTIGTPLTASRAIVTDGSGNLSASSVTSTTLGYLDATSSVQTQLDARALYGTAVIPGTGSACVWSGSTGSWTSYSADTDCNSTTVTGSLSAAGTKIPGFVYSPPAGTYLIIAQGAMTGTSTATCSFSMYDGTNRIGRGLTVSSTANINTLVGIVTYGSNQSGLTVQIQHFKAGGAGNCEVYDDNSDIHTLQFTVIRLS